MASRSCEECGFDEFTVEFIEHHVLLTCTLCGHEEAIKCNTEE